MCRGGARGHRAVAPVQMSKRATVVRVARVERGGVVQRPGEHRAVGERALRGGPRWRRVALTQTRARLWRVAAASAAGAAALTPVRGRGDLREGPEFGFRCRRRRVDNRGHVAGHRTRREAQVRRLVLLLQRSGGGGCGCAGGGLAPPGPRRGRRRGRGGGVRQQQQQLGSPLLRVFELRVAQRPIRVSALQALLFEPVAAGVPWVKQLVI